LEAESLAWSGIEFECDEAEVIVGAKVEQAPVVALDMRLLGRVEQSFVLEETGLADLVEGRLDLPAYRCVHILDLRPIHNHFARIRRASGGEG